MYYERLFHTPYDSISTKRDQHSPSFPYTLSSRLDYLFVFVCRSLSYAFIDYVTIMLSVHCTPETHWHVNSMTEDQKHVCHLHPFERTSKNAAFTQNYTHLTKKVISNWLQPFFKCNVPQTKDHGKCGFH